MIWPYSILLLSSHTLSAMYPILWGPYTSAYKSLNITRQTFFFSNFHPYIFVYAISIAWNTLFSSTWQTPTHPSIPISMSLPLRNLFSWLRQSLTPSSSFLMCFEKYVIIIFSVVTSSPIRLQALPKKGECFTWLCGYLPPQCRAKCWALSRCSGHVCEDRGSG